MIESYLHDQAVLYKSMEVHLCRYVSVARYCRSRCQGDEEEEGWNRKF